MRPVRRRSVVLGLVLLALALIPVFQINLLQPGDAYFFSNWDRVSQALVLGKIAEDESGVSSSRYGLVAVEPALLDVYASFDGLRTGRTPPQHFAAYPSSLGAQGYFFEAAYRAGCSSLGCLNTLESTLFSFTLVLFVALLAIVVRRSFAVTVLVTGLVSPWVVSAAHNLYWVPWTWLLPACAACAMTLARRRRWRIAWCVAAGAATALKASTGYEFLTTTTLLAASVPVLAHLLGTARSRRAVARGSAWIFGACAAGFLVTLTAHALVTGRGSLADGLEQILQDALKRTYGSAALAGDAITATSLHASVLTVLARYTIGWQSNLFGVGSGVLTPPLAIGPSGFWILLVGTCTLIGFELLQRDPHGARHLALLLATAAAPVSWYVIGKSHSFAATPTNYVLWYLVFIPALVWILGDAATSSRTGSALRRLTGRTTAYRPGDRDR